MMICFIIINFKNSRGLSHDRDSKELVKSEFQKIVVLVGSKEKWPTEGIQTLSLAKHAVQIR